MIILPAGVHWTMPQPSELSTASDGLVTLPDGVPCSRPGSTLDSWIMLPTIPAACSFEYPLEAK